MNIINDDHQAGGGIILETSREVSPPGDMAIREDQVAGLYRRAATFEEEEFLLNREVEELQTEINRLMLKLETMRAEREKLMDRIETLCNGPCDAGTPGLGRSANDKHVSFC